MDLSSLLKKKVENDILDIIKDPLNVIPNFSQAVEISKKFNVALHPKYTLYWGELSLSQFLEIILCLKKSKFVKKEDSVCLEIFNGEYKVFFEKIGLEHSIKKLGIEKASENKTEIIFLKPKSVNILFSNLGLESFDYNLNFLIKRCDFFEKEIVKNLKLTVFEIINKKNFIKINDKAGTYIGARMGRPEKAKIRKLDGSPHGLFSIGHGKEDTSQKSLGKSDLKVVKQNKMRNIIEAANDGKIFSQFCFFKCEKCFKLNLYSVCVFCCGDSSPCYFHKYDGSEVKSDNDFAVRYKYENLDITPYIEDYRKKSLNVELPKLVKGIKGMSSKTKIVENLTKAFLRQKHNAYVNKDGTIRFDMIEMGLTHFKPIEIGTSIEKLKILGYNYDYKGEKLTSNNQILEIFPQDVILPDCVQNEDESASDFVINTGNFIDELLEKLYCLKPFYNFKTKDDTIGHLIIGLAPHTSAGIVGRIIGYSGTQGCFSNPIWHAAQRRNLDGDENGIMLLLDGLINFSKDYLPDRRGTRTMDTALVLTSHLYLDQIDDEVHSMDTAFYYSLDLYRQAKKYANSKSLKIDKVKDKIGKKCLDENYFNFGFSHNVCNLNDTILFSSYKGVPTISEKLTLQLKIAEKIRAVDENQVGTLIIDKHFMKDIKGNLRKFSMQSFRCTNCNTIFRRPPLNGKCTSCNMVSINFTIHEGSIKKYLGISFDIVKNYKVHPYVVETLKLANLRIEGVFGKDLDKQKNLCNFFK